MKKILVVATATLFIISIVATAVGIQNPFTPTPMKIHSDDYDKMWQQVDSTDKIRQYKTARQLTKVILEKAKAEKNDQQTIKSIVYEAKYISYLEENTESKILNLYKKELEGATPIVAAILHSSLGSYFSSYADNNQWNLQGVTNTDKKPNPDDIGTWSLTDLVEAAFNHFNESVSDTDLLKLQITDYEVLVKNGTDSFLRPTLYDLLAHRALDFFTNERTYLVKPADKFEINQANALGNVETFLKTTFEEKEALAGKYQALMIFKKLLDFHKNDESPNAFVDADLKRLNFVQKHSTLSDKDELYLNALNELNRKYKENEVSAEIAAYIGDIYYSSGSKYERHSKDQKYKWDWKRSFEKYEEGIQAFPDSYGGKLCQQKQAYLMQKSLQMGAENVNLPNENMLTWIRYRNVPKAYFKIISIDETFKEAIKGKNSTEQINALNTRPVIKSWSMDLPNDGDLQEHQTEIKLDGLPIGEYYVMISDNEYFSYEYQAVAYMFTRVSKLSYFTKDRKNGEKHYYIVDRATGKPLKNVKAEFFKSQYNSTLRKSEFIKTGEAFSDKNGFVANSADDKRGYQVKLSKGADYLHLDNYLYESLREEDKTKTSSITQFFLDRAIYRPGQTVYFKGLAYKKDYRGIPEIVTNQKVKVTFYDANRQVVEAKEFTTNEFGTFNGSFKAPTGGLLGSMNIQSDFGNYSSRKSFKVEEYKRPKFEVKFDELAGSFKLSEQVKVTGQATAYAGNNIGNAEVKYRVYRRASFPYWRWWWGYPPTSNNQEITSGETTTDENGKFEVNFTAIPDFSLDEKNSPQFSYEVSVDVVDITGETHSQNTTVSVGYIALQAGISIPEQINKVDLKSWTISTSNLNGAFEPAKGTIAVYPLKTPNRIFKKRFWEKPDRPSMTKETFYKEIPSYAFSNEDEYNNWEKEAAILTTNFDTETSKTLELNNTNDWKSGKYQVVLQTQDKFGKKIEVVKYFELFDLEAKNVPAGAKDWFYAESKSYKPNETASFYFGSVYHHTYVLYEIFDNTAGLLHSEWVNVKKFKNFKVPIVEDYLGNVGASLTFIADNRGYHHNHHILVPWSNKNLKVEYQTFRDKLQPGQDETWKIKISGNKKEKVAAEVAAAMYDASLDAFVPNYWSLSTYPYAYPSQRHGFQSNFSSVNSNLLAQSWQPSFSARGRSYPSLQWITTYSPYGNFRIRGSRSNSIPYMSKSALPQATMGVVAEAEEMMVEDDSEPIGYSTLSDNDVKEKKKKENTEDLSDVKVRTNLNETVFFKPDLKTDEEGNVIIEFKMNEALTRWKFLLFAHTKDLSTAISTKEVVTQKELMVMPNPPRFLRENDEIHFTAKVSNLSETDLNGSAQLQLFDALSMEPIDTRLGNVASTLTFEAKKGQSAPLSWKLNIPNEGLAGVVYRVVAKAGKFSDGEENALPVLTNRMLLTETMPMSVRGNQKKDFHFKAMDKANGSETLTHHKATLEFTSNPAWYAVQALPYLMEYPYECTEQVFSRFYANSLAASVTNSHPKVKSVFEKWKNINTDALASNLSKNEELKYALLEETPWVLASQNEALQKKNIGLLFDLVKMENELDDAVKKMSERQLTNGGFAWFPGGRDSWYITQYIVEGMGHLKHLGVNEQLSGIQSLKKMDGVLAKAVKYTDDRMVERYRKLEELVEEGKTTFEENHLSYLDIHFLYARSFYPEIPMNGQTQKVHDYFTSQTKKYWMKHGLYSQGMMALSMFRQEEVATAGLIVKALEEQSLLNDEMGMYWKYNAGYYWYQLPIETHAMMIEVFTEVAKNDEAVADLKLWLLKNKQTTHWKTTKSTAAAVYALLMNGDNWLMEEEDVKITIGGDVLDQSNIQKEAGTGHFKIDWAGK